MRQGAFFKRVEDLPCLRLRVSTLRLTRPQRACLLAHTLTTTFEIRKAYVSLRKGYLSLSSTRAKLSCKYAWSASGRRVQDRCECIFIAMDHLPAEAYLATQECSLVLYWTNNRRHLPRHGAKHQCFTTIHRSFDRACVESNP